MGISHSHFLGGPALWDDHDRALALAYRQWKAECCPECGTRDEWFDDDPNAMYAQQGVCRGCEIKDLEIDRIPDKRKGVKVALFPDDETEAGRRIILTMAERE